MHWRGAQPTTWTAWRDYDDVVTEVASELATRVGRRAGRRRVRAEQVVLDPGLGFAKNAEHNWALLGRLGELAALGRPLLVGASRKRFLGSLLADAGRHAAPGRGTRRTPRSPSTALAARAGAWCVRVHDVRPSADAVRVVAAARAAAPAPVSGSGSR